ncbi:MAG: acyl-CoA dehydrogenase family protein [Acidimicrobiia bacterium]
MADRERLVSGTGGDVLALAEELAAEFADRAGAIDREGRFPHENIARLKETGYLSLPIPEDLGGRGADLATVCRAQSILAGGCASTALAANMHLFGLGAAAESLADGQDEARMVLQLAATGIVIGGSFTDAATGLNVRASSTPAERVDGGYKIHGRKAFCSLAPALDVFYGTAGLTDGSGLLLFAIGRDAPGLSFVDTWDTMAMRGTGSWDVIFDNVFVPEFMAQVGTPWDEWNRRSERMLSWFACTVAAVYLGIAEAANTFATSYLANRTMGGMKLPLSRQPGIIFGAGEVDALIRPARALLDDTLRRREDRLLPAHEVVAVKYCVTNAAVAAVERCFRMVGGSGLYRRLPIERMFRDVQAGPLHPPTNDLALEGLGRAALGIPPDAQPRWGD